jgi:TolB-like protein
VLPFENLTGDPAQTYIADGIAEALTSSLGALKGVRVISRTSAKACAVAGKSLAAIGRDLHVNAVVAGSVMRFAQFRVNARIVDVHSERVLWQGAYDCDANSLFTSCGHLARDIAAEIDGSPVQPRVSEGALPDTPAHLTYLKGRYVWSKRTEKDLYQSIEEFQRAIGIDPAFALAHTGLADAYTLVGIWGLEPPHSAFETARRAAARARSNSMTVSRRLTLVSAKSSCATTGTGPAPKPNFGVPLPSIRITPLHITPIQHC